ncbi:hypothetical protein IFM89_013423 [Coptis chinensis]|uniref:Uncharacterized protein n=1 Tax=Coptis chinensis TaxID=261450 RepID=A0A835GW06_9MAGN|nr:hypothetical protein IFM89_013423 [Coptis chinensis]
MIYAMTLCENELFAFSNRGRDVYKFDRFYMDWIKVDLTNLICFYTLVGSTGFMIREKGVMARLLLICLIHHGCRVEKLEGAINVVYDAKEIERGYDTAWVNIG